MNFPILIISCIYIINVLPLVYSNSYQIRSVLLSESKPTKYNQITKYCFIDDYFGWLQQRHEFIIWLDVASVLGLPINNDEAVQRQINLYNLQNECLRSLERLPVKFGPG